MAYSGCVRVAAMVPNLTNSASSVGAGELAVGIIPGSAAYIQWMSGGCALIEAKLKSLGYGTPVGTGTAIYDFLGDLEATYVAYRAEQARSSPRSAAGERTRANDFKEQFYDGLDFLAGMDLTRMGVAYTGYSYLGGSSESDKQSVESDSDRVQPRFSRGAFDGNFSSTAAS